MTGTTTERPAITTRGYQHEMLDESLRSNIIIALDTGAGKTHIALLRMKLEAERETTKVRSGITRRFLSCFTNAYEKGILVYSADCNAL